MVLTREEKERRVLELHNQRTHIRIIANEVGMSFRDIGGIIDKAEKQKEANEEQARKSIRSTRAYDLFHQDRTPVEVAIELNLREPEVTEYYKEYWKLKNLGELYQIYEEIKHDIRYLVEMFRLAKTAGMQIHHVIELLRIANNHLPWIEDRYNYLRGEVTRLELQIKGSSELLQNLKANSNYYNSCCIREMRRFNQLCKEREKQEALVRHFENNSVKHVKITKTVEYKVRATLSNSKDLLRRAVLSVTESIRNNPDRYSAWFFSNTPSTIDYNDYRYPHGYYGYGFYMYRQDQEQYPSMEEYAAMLVEDADKLYNKMVKDLGDEILSDYSASTSTLPSLPLFPDEEGLPPNKRGEDSV